MNNDKKSALKKPLTSPVQISKAPPPIIPLVSSPPKLPKFDTNVKGSPNWKHWRYVSTIEIWQGLLLSLNVEPPGKGWLLDNKPGATGDIPYEYLDNHNLTVEFTRRWYLVKNRLETRYATARLLPNAELPDFSSFLQRQLNATSGLPSNVELTNFLRLPLFAALAVEFEWEGMPPEFVALADDAQQAAPAAKDEAGTVTSPGGDSNNPTGTANKVYWRVILNLKIKEIDGNKKANVRKIIKYLRGLGDKRLPNKGSTDELFWINDMGTERSVGKKTVNNAASQARKLP